MYSNHFPHEHHDVRFKIHMTQLLENWLTLLLNDECAQVLITDYNSPLNHTTLCSMKQSTMALFIGEEKESVLSIKIGNTRFFFIRNWFIRNEYYTGRKIKKL